MEYWRVTASNQANIWRALETRVWGEDRAKRLEPIHEGDRLALYCSGSPGKGFWATATVAGPRFISHQRIWYTGDYPFRIPLHIKEGPTERPVQARVVLEELEAKQFENTAPRKAIYRLMTREFEVIERMVRAAAVSV